MQPMKTETTIVAPVDEILMAVHLIYEDRGEGGILDEMPMLVALWEANRERAEWLLNRRHHVSELDSPLVEPPIVVPAKLRSHE
jgi:hypothetical protein